jgi:chaperonin GroEL
LDEGVVAGGGVTLVNLVSSITTSDADDDAVAAGKALLKKALEQPFRILLTNSGLNADEWLPQIKKGKPGHGVNVNDPSKLVDLKAAGVVDPARVTKEALMNAVSIAGTSMTMGALVVEVPEKESAPAMGGGGMGGMGGGMGMGM